MGSFFGIFFDMFLAWWWLILPLVFSPYIYYFFTSNRHKNNHQQVVEKDEEYDERLNVMTVEKKHLGIDLDDATIKTYYKRLKLLVELLQNSKGRVTVNAVEAILLVEYFSKSVLVNENSELVVELKVINEFCQKIYDDPMKFITYVKAVENKIDLERKENKLELGTLLYMMRNAKKFGLYIDTEDSEFTFQIKSSIHKSNYDDVIINVVEDLDAYKERLADEEDFILVNTYDSKELSTDEEEDDDEDDSVFLSENPNIESVERIEDNKIKIVAKDGSVIIKDDRTIYSITRPTPVEVEAKVETSKLNASVPVVDQVLKSYVNRFKELDEYEKQTKIFKDRSKRHFEEQLVDRLSFDRNKVHEDCEIEEEFFHCLLSNIFKEEYAIGDDGLNFIFIGEVVLKDGNKISYCTIDAHYFLNLMYLCIKRDYRENFFNYILSFRT